jgi:hypothetical protein
MVPDDKPDRPEGDSIIPGLGPKFTGAAEIPYGMLVETLVENIEGKDDSSAVTPTSLEEGTIKSNVPPTSPGDGASPEHKKQVGDAIAPIVPDDRSDRSDDSLIILVRESTLNHIDRSRVSPDQNTKLPELEPNAIDEPHLEPDTYGEPALVLGTPDQPTRLGKRLNEEISPYQASDVAASWFISAVKENFFKIAHLILASIKSLTTIYEIRYLLGWLSVDSESGIFDEYSLFLASVNVSALFLVYATIYSIPVINSLKLFVESCLEEPIVWWPWEPPLERGFRRVYWTCVRFSPQASNM